MKPIVDAQILNKTVLAKAEELLEGKSPEYIKGFNDGWDMADEYLRELMKIPFKDLR